MAAYMLILAEISDPEQFMKYAVEASRLVAEFGGEYVLKGASEVDTLEGEWDENTKVVISKWPDMAAARRFWESEQYQQARKLREGVATVRVRLLEAL